jgi:processive 1,2-diacylglycerol beta-glucosyltransferase
MVLINPVPGQEGGNAKFFQNQGAAVIARGWKRIVARTAQLIRDPDRIARMSQACIELYHPGRETIAEHICSMLDSPADRD